MSKTREPRDKMAERVREAALALLAVHGRWIEASGLRLKTADVGPFLILHRTPFGGARERFKVSGHMKAQAAAMGLRVDDPKPYGLDVWYQRRKVANMEWAPGAPIEIVSLRGGSWRDELTRLSPV